MYIIAFALCVVGFVLSIAAVLHLASGQEHSPRLSASQEQEATIYTTLATIFLGLAFAFAWVISVNA